MAHSLRGLVYDQLTSFLWDCDGTSQKDNAIETDLISRKQMRKTGKEPGSYKLLQLHTPNEPKILPPNFSPLPNIHTLGIKSLSHGPFENIQDAN